MKDIGRLGVWIFPDALSTGEIVALAEGAERLGYDCPSSKHLRQLGAFNKGGLTTPPPRRV